MNRMNRKQIIPNRLFALVAGSAVAAGLSVAALAGPGHQGGHATDAGAKTVTITGELIDTACYVASDGGAKGEDHADCAKQCLASGIPAGILPEGAGADGYLVLLTNPKPLAEHAGKTIRVTGDAKPAMHAFDAKKVEVKGADGQFTEVKLEDYHHQMSDGEDAAKPDAPKDAGAGGHGHAGHQ